MKPDYAVVIHHTRNEEDGSISHWNEWVTRPLSIMVDRDAAPGIESELRKQGYRFRRRQWLTRSDEYVRPFPLWLACKAKDKAIGLGQSAMWFLFVHGVVHKTHPELMWRWRDLRLGRPR